MRQFTVDNLTVLAFDTTQEMAERATHDVVEACAAYRDLPTVNMMLAGAESQKAFQQTLARRPEIDWDKVHAFNIDDYWDPAMDPKFSVGACVDAYLYDSVHPAKLDRVNPIAGDVEPERARYEQILGDHHIHIACIGIGESGHIGLNEPGQTRFDDPALARVVTLPPASVAQLERDEFLGGTAIPTMGITTTISKLMEAERIFVIVPYHNKAEIVARMLSEPVSEDLPATILRRHANARLYLDAESAYLIA